MEAAPVVISSWNGLSSSNIHSKKTSWFSATPSSLNAAIISELFPDRTVLHIVPYASSQLSKWISIHEHISCRLHKLNHNTCKYAIHYYTKDAQLFLISNLFSSNIFLHHESFSTKPDGALISCRICIWVDFLWTLVTGFGNIHSVLHNRLFRKNDEKTSPMSLYIMLNILTPEKLHRPLWNCIVQSSSCDMFSRNCNSGYFRAYFLNGISFSSTVMVAFTFGTASSSVASRKILRKTDKTDFDLKVLLVKQQNKETAYSGIDDGLTRCNRFSKVRKQRNIKYKKR